MKRYSEIDIRVHGAYGEEYVEADTAQELYDTLVYVLEHESRISLPLKVQLKMVETIKNVDKEG